MDKFGWSKQDRTWAAPELAFLGVFIVPAPQDDSEETPRMVVAVGMEVRGVELVKVDIKPGTFDNLVSGKFFPYFGPADLFMWD